MTTLVLYNGPIYTLDPALPKVAAVAIRDGRIMAAGSEGKIQAAVGGRAEVINLQGRAVIPAMTDAHVHLIFHALARREVQLQGLGYEDAVMKVAQAAEQRPAGTWITGGGWDHSSWGHWPHAKDLDALVPDHPVMLSRRDGHSIWVNSLALKLAGIDEQTSDPDGGHLRREQNQLTGVLVENAIELVRRHVPLATQEERFAAMQEVFTEAYSYGMVGMHIPTSLEPGDGALLLRDLQTLRERGQLGLRCLTYLGLDGLDAALALGLRSGLGDRWLRVGGLKFFADGSLGSETAEMLTHYEGRRHLGMAVIEEQVMNDTVRRAIHGGLAVMVHAIGDAANRKVLNAIELALQPIDGQAAPTLAIPNRIEHCQIVHPRDIPRFSQLGVVASMQPVHCISDMTVASELWGSRCATAYAWRALKQAGATLAFGSDAPVESLNPWLGVYAAVTRQRYDGTPAEGWYPEQRLTVTEALTGFTRGSALAAAAAHEQGRIAPGMLADLAVLSADPMSINPSGLQRINADITILEGNVVWERR